MLCLITSSNWNFCFHGLSLWECRQAKKEKIMKLTSNTKSFCILFAYGQHLLIGLMGYWKITHWCMGRPVQTLNPWKHHHSWSQVVNFLKFVFPDALKMQSLALFVLRFLRMAVTNKVSQTSSTNNVDDWVMQLVVLGCIPWMTPAGLLVKVSEPLETHIVISSCVMLINYSSLKTAWAFLRTLEVL